MINLFKFPTPLGFELIALAPVRAWCWCAGLGRCWAGLLASAFCKPQATTRSEATKMRTARGVVGGL